MGMNGLIMSHVLNQKHDSKDSGSLCMGSFSSSWWCPLCRTVYLGRKARKHENSTGVLQMPPRECSHPLPLNSFLPHASESMVRWGRACGDIKREVPRTESKLQAKFPPPGRVLNSVISKC